MMKLQYLKKKIYWNLAWSTLKRTPPCCAVAYIPHTPDDMILHIYITRPETRLEWAVAALGVLLGRNRFFGSHVCFSVQNSRGNVVQFDMTFDGMQSYYNVNPLRDVHFMLSLPIDKKNYLEWIPEINTIDDLKLKVKPSDAWRWLFGLPVVISCTSVINYLLFKENVHLDPDELIEKVLNDSISRLREDILREESL